jgi:hypothetical protein
MSAGKILILILLPLVIIACSETQDAFYKNIDEAIKHGAIERGWIPNVLPRSSYEIYEWHDLDTNIVRLKFKFDKKDINELVAQIEEVKPDEINAVVFPSPNISWWPRELTKDSIINGPSGLGIYKYNRVLQFADNRQQPVPGFFVIDWNSNIAYYWQ